MPNIKSAKKRVTVIARRKEENRFVKSTLSTYIKNFRLLVNAGELEQAEKLLPEVVSYINSAETKGVVHKNTASRKVSRLSAMLSKAKAEVKVEEKPAKKTVEAEEVKEEVKEEVTPKKRASKKAE